MCKAKVFRAVGCGVLALGLLTSLAAQSPDSRRGRAALERRGCLECHRVLGGGAGDAPELGRPGEGAATAAAFAAGVWNHSGEMWGEATPERSELLDIYAFLHASTYFDPPGSQTRGREIFQEKQCYRCHALVIAAGESTAPPVPRWPALEDPVQFLTAMWNHGELMGEDLAAAGLPWPELTATDVNDLLAYLYDLPDLPAERGELRLGRASAGMRLFDDLSCAECHTLVEGDRDAVPLRRAGREAGTLTGLAAAMWSHQPIMREWAEATGLEIRPLAPEQMSALLAYLMEEALFETPGDPDRGGRLFTSRGCLLCHSPDGDHPLERGLYDPIDMIEGAWRHGAEMREELAEEGLPWPRFTEQDLADLSAYLSSR